MAQHDCTLSLRTYLACCALQGSAEEPYSIGFFLEEIGSESDGIEMMEVRRRHCSNLCVCHFPDATACLCVCVFVCARVLAAFRGWDTNQVPAQ